MIIERISIENYLCYYGINLFALADGLNVILGENGEGKTKFFEAVEWVFRGDDKHLDKLVSAKKLNETDVGDSFSVRVSITVHQYGEKYIITKSFLATKNENETCSTSSLSIEGIEENNSGERSQVDGKKLLDRVFPFQIRKYSMFKGESELDIFKNDDALLNLINLFSDAKHFDKYTSTGEYLRSKAEKAVDDSTKTDKKNELQYKKIEYEIQNLEQEKHKVKVHLASTDEELSKLESNIQDAEKHVNNADALKTINHRIKNIEENISKLQGKIDENYTRNLFDENWIAVNFESIHKEYAEKIKKFGQERRKQQSEFDKQKGIKEGEKKAKAELLNNAIPLPIGIPSKEHMEEMLQDEICKVCNREAKKDSEAYLFMLKRLENYLKSQEVQKTEENEDEFLFKNEYISLLAYLSRSHEDNLKYLRGIRTKIKDLFEFNKHRKKDIEELKDKLENERTERERILGNSDLAEDSLVSVLKNYTAWQSDLTNRNREKVDYEQKLKEIVSELKSKNKAKDDIDMESANSFLIKTREVLRDIETIFKETKEKKFDSFIQRLESKSNEIFAKINIDAFTGTIVLKKATRHNKTRIDVVLEERGRTFHKPNQSLQTSMYIAILFAISELASEINEEKYPLIFDAPTSSFGKNKTSQFLNLLFETSNQKILLIKEFLVTDDLGKLIVKEEFKDIKRDKAFWVKVERPFDQNDLTTINTNVISL